MDFQLGVIETKFADLIWDNEPILTSQLVKLSAEAFSWKKSTTYTVLSRLCGKGLFKNESGTVTSLVTKEAFHAEQSRQFVQDSFGGSLPAFLAAFMSGRKISEKDISEIRAMIQRYREEKI